MPSELATRPAGDSALPSLLVLYERMLLIRCVEERLGRLFRDGKIPGFIHLSIGQEAVAVGVTACLGKGDTLASTHRGHGHALAKGMEPSRLFLEIAGKAEGICRGRGGSLHVADFSVGMLGANGIVAAGIPIALGSALAHKRKKAPLVSVAMFGDGALAEGVLHEVLNCAAIWNVPLLLACENNGWSEFSLGSSQFRGKLKEVAGAFAIPFRSVDGNDVEEVASETNTLITDMRRGEGPAVLECRTLRVGGHYEGDPQSYRARDTEETVEDPLARALQRLAAQGLTAREVDDIARRVEAEVDKAEHAISRGSDPDFHTLADAVYARETAA